MALILKKTAPYRYDAMSREWKVARIEMADSDVPEAGQWKWTAVGLPSVSDGLILDGATSSVEAAMQDIQVLFVEWLERAGLSEKVDEQA